MNRKIFIVIICILLLLTTGCTKKINQNDDIKRLYLTDKYYNKGNFIQVSNDDLSKLDDETYVLFTYNNYCTLPISCENIFKEFMEKYKIDFLSITFEDYKNTKFYDVVKYAPSILIISKGDVIAYLDANSDDDLDKYQDVDSFEQWLNNYIYFNEK
jgi:hypothetical protein